MQLPLREVRKVSSEPYEKYRTKVDAKGDEPNLITTAADPPTTALLVDLTQRTTSVFAFPDAGLADRFSKAIARGARLCGGGYADN
jgi:hypothetical protein